MAKPKMEDIKAMLAGLSDEQRKEVAMALGVEDVVAVLKTLDLTARMAAEKDLNKANIAELQANAMSPENLKHLEVMLQGICDQYVSIGQNEPLIVAVLTGLKRYRAIGGRNYYCRKEDAWRNNLYKIQEYFTGNFLTLVKRLKADVFSSLSIPAVRIDSSLYRIEDIDVPMDEYVKLAPSLELNGGLKDPKAQA